MIHESSWLQMRGTGHLNIKFSTEVQTVLEKRKAGHICGLLSAKGGLMMGTKKVGALTSPRKRANVIIAKYV